jgi:hypothetical protein
MGLRRSASLTPIALLTALSIAPGQDAGGLVREGKHFRVVFHGAELTEELAIVLVDECLASAEAFWPTLDKLLPVRVTKPNTIHVYRSEKEYREVETKNGARFPLDAIVAKNDEAHVWLHPPLSKEILTAIGLPQPTIDDLRRVAAEQVVAPLAPSNDDQDWLRTVVVMGAVEAAANPRHLPGVDSAHDRRRYHVAASRRDGEHDTFESLLAVDMTCVERWQWDNRMAWCAWVAQVLATENGWAKKLLGKQRELKGHVHAYDRRKVAVESVLGNDAAKNEARWQKVCKAIQPVWATRSGVWMIGPQRSMLVGTKVLPATVDAVELPPKGDYVISGRCEFGAGNPESDFRVEIGWDGQSLVGANFHPEGVTISVWQQDKEKWDEKGHRDIALGVGKPFGFRVEVTAAEVRAIVDGAPPVVWAYGGREMHTQWSFSCNDRVVWLEGLKIEPLPPAKK